ncbi:hypothetical protein Val02_09730 [Virgisporangium aliadipatigenens]|uniref:Response regulatory domain-containing protein n=1 Tax=Virgisporangium aliadipatigenens TaxID=741659 RepID=A0A8J3YGR2_9ACTN|nr:response regulator [Virgisporangium aliadipatigenens]GIJ44087.1 hypothetical protein Val02_09730 [Virgisporangium aliadipatigenens]
MGGDITVAGVEGAGSTFTLTAVLHTCPQPDPTLARADLAGRAALGVDDNATNRTVLRRRLTGWGMRCVDVASAAEALDPLALGARFDVAVLDVHMPDVDGAGPAAALRGLPMAANLPMVLLSSVVWRPEPDQQKLFDAMLSKPARATTLQRTLTRLLVDAPTATPDVEEPAAPAQAPAWHPSLRVTEKRHRSRRAQVGACCALPVTAVPGSNR